MCLCSPLLQSNSEVNERRTDNHDDIVILKLTVEAGLAVKLNGLWDLERCTM